MRHFGRNSHSALRCQCRTGNGFRWLLADPSWLGHARRVEAFLADPNPEPEGFEIIRHRKSNRLVMRLAAPPEGPRQSLVAKICFMDKLRHCLYRWPRYGPDEAASLLEAARRGLPVPAVIGLGLRRQWGLVRCSVILMEDLAPRDSMRNLLGEGVLAPENRRRMIMSSVDLLLKMYHASCQNIDFNDGSVLVMPDSTAPRIVDFEYTRFLKKPDAGVLAFQAALMSRFFARQSLPGEWIEAWVRELAQRADMADNTRWWALYRDLCTKELGRKQRQGIRFNQ